MLSYSRSLIYYYYYYHYSKQYRLFYLIFIFLLSFASIWLIINISSYSNNDQFIDNENIPDTSRIFCFVLSANKRHLTSSKAIVYSWGKRCDRFYFITRLDNTSSDLLMLEKFEKNIDITSKTITQHTLNALRYLENELLFSSYQWFIRATDDSFIIIPNLRRYINQLEINKYNKPLAYVGDVEYMYKQFDIKSTGSVMLFNRKALNYFVMSYIENQLCSFNMIYDHELVGCMKDIGININPIDDNLILSLDLAKYKMNEHFKVIYKYKR